MSNWDNPKTGLDSLFYLKAGFDNYGGHSINGFAIHNMGDKWVGLGGYLWSESNNRQVLITDTESASKSNKYISILTDGGGFSRSYELITKYEKLKVFIYDDPANLLVSKTLVFHGIKRLKGFRYWRLVGIFPFPIMIFTLKFDSQDTAT